MFQRRARAVGSCVAAALCLASAGCLRARPPGAAVEASAPNAGSTPHGSEEPGGSVLLAEPSDRDAVGVVGDAPEERLRQVLRHLARAPGFALGQQDATAYGVGWSGDADRSDVKSLCGSHVAVHGWDIFRVENGAPKNGDGVSFEHMRRLIAEAHRRGGLNTISWHMDNPRSGGNAWDRTPAVRDILPGGPLHQRYLGFLQRGADFLHGLRTDGGEPIPVVFRPFHEHTGSWFWWGSAHTTDQDFVALWRFTVDYLRRERGLSLLVAFSPGGGEVQSESDYLYRYPGDDYVDVLGVDEYSGNDASRLLTLAEVVVRVAEAHGKIPAITEFGARGGLNGSGIRASWIEQAALRPLLESPVATRLAYALAWRNARVDHCFLPYPGHAAAAAFQSVCADERLLLEADLVRLR